MAFLRPVDRLRMEAAEFTYRDITHDEALAEFLI